MMSPIVFVSRAKPPVKLNGDDMGSDDWGVLNITGNNWSNVMV